MTLRKRKKRADPVTIAEPTPEQQARASYDREIQTGMAAAPYRRVPAITELRCNGILSQRQYDGLDRYRGLAIAAEKSELRSCLDFSPCGNGEGQAPFGVRVSHELGWLERELHGLLNIARAVAVEDLTLDQYVSLRLATIGLTQAEERNIKAGARKIATVEIRTAGEWLAAAIGA